MRAGEFIVKGDEGLLNIRKGLEALEQKILY
jgi:hypothetical protein